MKGKLIFGRNMKSLDSLIETCSKHVIYYVRVQKGRLYLVAVFENDNEIPLICS